MGIRIGAGVNAVYNDLSGGSECVHMEAMRRHTASSNMCGWVEVVRV